MGSIVALGLMSRPLGDGVDGIAIECDGISALKVLCSVQLDYTPPLQELLRAATEAAPTCDRLKPDPLITEASHVLMQIWVEAVRQLVSKASLDRNMIMVLGLMGHPLYAATLTQPAWTLGDPALLAAGVDMPVAAGFRPQSDADVTAEMIALAATKKEMRLAIDIPGIEATSPDDENISVFQPETPWVAR